MRGRHNASLLSNWTSPRLPRLGPALVWRHGIDAKVLPRPPSPQPSPYADMVREYTNHTGLTGDIAHGRASRSSRFRCAIPPIEQGIERSRVLVWASLRRALQ